MARRRPAHRRLGFIRRRELMGYSQAELATAVGVATFTISRWEHAECDPQPTYRRKLMELLKVTPEQLDLLLTDIAEVDAEGKRLGTNVRRRGAAGSRDAVAQGGGTGAGSRLNPDLRVWTHADETDERGEERGEETNQRSQWHGSHLAPADTARDVGPAAREVVRAHLPSVRSALDTHDLSADGPVRSIQDNAARLVWMRQLNEAADEALAQAALASAGLHRPSVADLFGQLADIAQGYATRDRWETFRRARRGRDIAQGLTGQTRRPTDLVDVYLLSSLFNAVMAAAAFDLARWSAAASLARASCTFADLSGSPSAVGWARGLLATLMNWQKRPGSAVREVEAAMNARPSRAARYRLYCIAARAHALRGDRPSARDALEQAARHRPDEHSGSDLLNDELCGEFQFDPARAAACAGAVWLHLHDGTSAEQTLSEALTAYAAVPAHDRPIAPVQGAHVDLAAARLLQHDLDGATDPLKSVFEVPPEQRISVLAGRLAAVQHLLRDRGWGGTPQALALSERIDDWMSGAMALPIGGVN